LLLLERIQALEKGRPDTGDQAALQRSVMRHLSALLNTRRGSVPIAEDYGIGETMDIAGDFSKEGIATLERDLEAVIGKYEPRLANVKVTFAPRNALPLTVVFRIDASLATETGPRPLRLETILDADGAVHLQDASSIQDTDQAGSPPPVAVAGIPAPRQGIR
jgi:type VI secretion system protein